MGSERTPVAENAADLSRGSFSTGCNCAESVLDAAGAALGLPPDAIARSSGYAWTGGIDESGCLCGALASAVSLAGLVAEAEGGTEAEQRARARALADEMRREFVGRWRSTCCRVVRNGLAFGTPECRANCEEVTAFTTALALDVLGRERATRLRGLPAAARLAGALAVGAVAGIELATLAAVVGQPALAAACTALGVVGGAVWGALAVGSPRFRRDRARAGRWIAAAVAAVAAVLAIVSSLAPDAPASGPALSVALGVPAAAPALRVLWVAVLLAFAVPALRDLARRRGAG